MSRRSTKLLKVALSTLHYTGVDGMMAPLAQGVGVVFMLHHVAPEEPAEFEPNRILKVTPDFLDAVIEQVKASGFDIVSLDDVHYRLREGLSDRPFACFTFDDGWVRTRQVSAADGARLHETCFNRCKSSWKSSWKRNCKSNAKSCLQAARVPDTVERND